MLSIEDIYREIGKNIFICPLDTNNFRDNSIDLTASEFAWTADGRYLFDAQNRTITVPKHTTACILTKEAIYVSAKIGGTYHSRVSLTKMGFGHIGTMLDPKYCGQSLIMLHNTTDADLILKEGERLVSLVFYYLSTPILEKILSTPPSHSNKVAMMDLEGRYQRWCNDNQWANNPTLLKAYFAEHYLKEFKEKKKIYAQKKNIIEQIWASAAGRLLIKYIVIVVLLSIALFLISHYFAPSDKSGWAGIILPTVICLVGLLSGDISNKQR